MENLAKAAIILATVLLVVLTAHFTLSGNLEAGIYPVHADSIGIPLFETIAASLLLLVFLLAAFVLTNFAFFRRWILFVPGLLLYALAAFVAGEMAWSWVIPHHYSIAAAYGLVAGVAVVLAVLALRRWPTRKIGNKVSQAEKFRAAD